MKKHGALLVMLLTAIPAFAQDTTVLQDVIVTANRFSLKKWQLPQKLDVITSRDITLNPSIDVGDILKKMAALDVIQRPGAATYATIRGFRPPVEPGRINPEVTVLINGRQSGTQNLALFDPNSIERIEVLKGAAGAIYGSSTMGGLINIITKQSKGKVSGQVYGGFGSFKTAEAGFAVGGNILPKLDFNFSGTYYNRNDDIRFGNGNIFRKLLGSEEVELFPATGPVKEFDTAYDGKRRNGTKMNYRSNSLRIGYQLNDNWRIDVSGATFSGPGIESSGDLRTMDSQQGYANRFFNTADISVKGIIGNHALSVMGYLMKEENSTFNNYNGTTVILPVPTYQRSEGIVEWKGIQLQDVVTLRSNIRIIAGADYNEATSQTRAWAQGTAAEGFPVSERAPSSPYSYVKTLAPFAQLYLTALKDKLVINPSVRYDFINFGIVATPLFQNLTPRKEQNDFFSPSLGLQYNITENLALHSNAGRAFRFAQAFEMAGYFEEYITGNKVRITTGNPSLKNEQSATWDAGIKYRQATFTIDITWFQTHVKNRIKQIALPEKVGQTHADGRSIDRYLTYTNADEAQMRGLELDGSYDVTKHLRLFANLTHLIKAVDITKGKPDEIRKIRNVAPLNIGYGLQYTRKTWQARLSGRYLSKRYGQDFGHLNTTLRGAYMNFPRYMTLDLVASYTVAAQHMVSLRISNVTDENYYETRGYNMPGRSIGLRYTYLINH